MAHSSFTSEEDFAAAYERYADDIFRHCYLRVFCRDTAKALMTEAFTRLWQFIADGNYVDSTRLYLYRVTHALIKQHEMQATEPVAAAQIADEDDHSAELALLRKVPAEDRPVLVLHYVDGFSLREIGEIVGGAVQDHSLSLRKGTSVLSSLLA